MTNDQEAQMKWHCKPLKLTGNCFGYFPFTPASVPFPEIRATHDKLRSGCCYSSVDRDGTRYSETVEQRGNEQVSISADPTEIVPNQSGNNPDEATSQLTVKVTCDGVPLKDRQVGLRIDVKPRSGYHNHTDKRPRGQFAVIGKKDTSCGVETGAPEGSDDKSCVTVKTGASGEAKVKFKSSLTGSITWAKYGKYYSGIAGDYKITAKDEQLTEVRGDTIVVAEVKDLQPASFDSNLVQGRADISDSSSHPDGSWGTPGTLSAFSNLANDFFKYQDLHNTALLGCGKQPWKSINYPNKNVEPLSMNDIALPTGGVFDWHQTWRPSHQTHNKGEGGDFNRFAAAVEKNWEKKGTDCHGDTNVLLEWYMQVLLDLGKKYGSWDCADLGASGAYPVFSPDACAKGELPDVGTVTTPLVTPGYEGPAAPPFIYFPPLLHLHVYRRLGGDG
jgi:hypothetical protein